MAGSKGILRRGHVKDVRLDRGFGFVAVAGCPDAYFDAARLDSSLRFDAQLVGREVTCYVEVLDDGRARARGLRPAW